MPSAADAASIVGAHHDQLLASQDFAGTRAGLAWDQFANIDQRAAAAFLDAVVPVMDATTAHVGSLAAAMYGLLDDLDGIVPSGPPSGVPLIRGGTSTETVFERGVVRARTMVKNGSPWADAMAGGRAQTVSAARTNVILANRSAADNEAARRPHVVGFRRVLTGRSCVMCAIASTQRYRRAELLPIHSHCDCDVAPIIGDVDPGRIINRELYRELRRSGASDELSLQQAASRARQRADGNRAQVDKWRSQLEDETDPARLRRLEDRIDRYDERARRAEASAEHASAQLKEYRSARGGPMRTVDVHEHGELGKVLTDSMHDFDQL